VVIEDGYAITSIEQVLFNLTSNDLEAKYYFPVPRKSAIGEFTHWIDGKPVTADLVVKEKARNMYQQVKWSSKIVR